MKVKDHKPTYQYYEVVCLNPFFFRSMSKRVADKEIGDYEILSVLDYPSSGTTSIVIKQGEREGQCLN